MRKENLKRLHLLMKIHKLDGYIIPKNDSFFTEQVKYDRLKLVSGFSGSAGIAVILKKKNYLFVDSRYSIQAKIESGNNFKILNIYEKLPKNYFKSIVLGFDPKLFTYYQLEYLFGKKIDLKPVKNNLIDQILKKKKGKDKPFYSIPEFAAGISHKKKN